MYPLQVADPSTGIPDVEAKIDEVSFMKNGVKFPLEESIDTRDIQTDSLTDKECPRVPLVKNFVNAVIPLKHLNHSSLSLNNLSSEIYADTDVRPGTTSTAQDGKSRIFGIGVNCDDLSNVGVNMKGSTFSQRVVSGLDGLTPKSCFTFVQAFVGQPHSHIH